MPEHDAIGKAPGWYASYLDFDPRNYHDLPRIRPVREILANDRDANNFGIMLKTMAHPRDRDQQREALARLERYFYDVPTDEDMKFITYAAHEFSKWALLGESGGLLIGPQQLELYSRRHRAIYDAITHQGPDRALELIRRSIMYRAMTDPTKIQDFYDQLVRYRQFCQSDAYKRLEAESLALCNEVNITIKQYDSMYDLSEANVEATLAKLKLITQKTMTPFERTLDNAKGSMRLSKAHNLMGRARLARQLTPQSIQNDVTGIAEYIAETISNPEFRSHVAQEVIRNENLSSSMHRGPQTHDDVKRTLAGQVLGHKDQ